MGLMNYSSGGPFSRAYTHLPMLLICLVTVIVVSLFYWCGVWDGKRDNKVGGVVNLNGRGVVVESGDRLVIEVGDNGGYFMVDDGLFRKKYHEVLIVNKVSK